MKNRASLVLIELCIMLLVLAVSAAVCLRIFLWADQTSKDNAARDMAVIQMQSVAETIKGFGSLEEGAKAIGATQRTEAWIVAGEDYEIRITPLADEKENLGSALLEAVCGDTVLMRFTVSWQEVA